MRKPNILRIIAMLVIAIALAVAFDVAGVSLIRDSTLSGSNIFWNVVGGVTCINIATLIAVLFGRRITNEIYSYRTKSRWHDVE